ncbi:MAG: chorismate synthase [Melioribacteraceae bacterium]|nr:MAG: chorismate synthase [Melioribacteraceae bacterium]
MIRFLTAGESHGKGLTAIVEGMPSNVEIPNEYINSHLARRQLGYGRGGRMKIETDKAEITGGIRFKKTLGSPVSMYIQNRDWENWTDKMSPESDMPKDIEKITIPRPGHADLVGATKYNLEDIRNSIERSSARETAARVAACSVPRKMLENLGIYVGSYVESIGGIYPENSFYHQLLDNDIPEDLNAVEIAYKADKSKVRVLEQTQEEKIVEKIKVAKKNGDTLGGTMVAFATGVPAGLGSFVHYDTKMDTEIAASIMSINAIKGVEIGSGFLSAEIFGSESHDEIIKDGKMFSRKSNRAGGIEGGISTGLPIIVRAAMKPIATLMSPIGTVDLATMNEIEARRERSDFVAVPACAVIMESMLAWSIAGFVIQKFGGDSFEEIKERFENYKLDLETRLERNFKG